MFNGLLPAAHRGGSARPSQLACGGASTSDDRGRCGKAFRGVNTWRNGVCPPLGHERGQECGPPVFSHGDCAKKTLIREMGHLESRASGSRFRIRPRSCRRALAGSGPAWVPPRTRRYRNTSSKPLRLHACARFSGGPRKHQLLQDGGAGFGTRACWESSLRNRCDKYRRVHDAAIEEPPPYRSLSSSVLLA